MELFFSHHIRFSALINLTVFLAIFKLADCYDPLDPNGNITITFDVHRWTDDGYMARVTIQNYYLYRHVDKPGWRMGWTWVKNEIIWSISGAIATQQGNCSSHKYSQNIPHCCKTNPVIVDLIPNTLPENKVDGCCRDGVLSAYAIDTAKSFSSFEIKVGNLGMNTFGYAPQNFTLMAPGPGYTCGLVEDVDPTVFWDMGGRRQVPVFRTWKTICTYSKFLANKVPTCCASLSTFYNPTITSCPICSCGCRDADQTTISCIRENSQVDSVDSLDIVQCTDHMCPIRIHWHIKYNYVEHWRVKLTISNYNYKRNYSNWNVLVQHPGFSQKMTTFSFNKTMIATVGFPDEVALFWGLNYYNEELLHGNDAQVGSVTTEILLQKDLDSFTLSNGWAFPRRIYFNGDDCGMPLPDTFPTLPNNIASLEPVNCFCFLLLSYLKFTTMVHQY